MVRVAAMRRASADGVSLMPVIVDAHRRLWLPVSLAHQVRPERSSRAVASKKFSIMKPFGEQV